MRREHRGQGLNATLLDAAIAYARDGGARVIEAYPIDTSEGKTATNDLFHGALSTFEAAGFEEVGKHCFLACCRPCGAATCRSNSSNCLRS